MKRTFRNIYSLTLTFLAIMLISCSDFLEGYGNGKTLEGNCTLTLDLGYTPLAAALTRSAGDAVREIDHVYILFYNKDGTELKYAFTTKSEAGDLYEKITISQPENIDRTSDDFKPENDDDWKGTAEEKTQQATTSPITIEQGTYKILVVANVDAFSKLTKDKINTIDKVRNYKLEWDGEQQQYVTAMYGFFTESENDGKDVINGAIPTITLSKPTASIHAWMKRAVAKVTVAYDGSGLNEGVSITIKSVQIKDIARECLLGTNNSATTYEGLINGETIQYKESDNNAITNENPYFPRKNNSDDTIDQWKSQVHSEGTDALYCFENLQGTSDYTKDPNGKPQTDENDNKIPDDADKGINKDGKDYGTYIEVRAYYKNGDNDEGNIVYRFMLGKNITDNFDVERNNHYKLTMRFRGNANDVDWHIEYPELPYFRIPYNIDDDIPDTGFEDVVNNETWYKNENWNQSWVWYAYDENHNPIAEICKELVYYDSRDNGYNLYCDYNNASRKFYQVVTVYPIKNNGETDLKNGIIAQVLACDTDEPGHSYFTKINGAKISMYYRYELNPNAEKANAKYGATVIKSSELTPNIANGIDDLKHPPYHYVKYDKENNTLGLIEKPQHVLLPTRPYKVQDYDKNEYPIVKVGASYWFRENLRTKTLDLEGTYKVYPYETGHLPSVGSHYDLGWWANGCVYFPEAYPMYKIFNNDINGETYGLLYNLAAIAGSEEYDPFLFFPMAWETGQFNPDYEAEKAGDMGYLPQFNNSNTQDRNEWQITPNGWHITEGGGDFVTWSDDTRTYGEVWYDHQYILDYLGNDMFRATRDKGTIQWPHTDNPNKEIKQRNLSGLSFWPIPADGTSSNVLYKVSSAAKLEAGMVIPYWTDAFMMNNSTPLHGGNYDTGFYAYAHVPFFSADTDYSKQQYGEACLICEENMKPTQYQKDISAQYLPVRPVRHSFKYRAPGVTNNGDEISERQSSYLAQKWEDIRGSSWEWKK